MFAGRRRTCPSYVTSLRCHSLMLGRILHGSTVAWKWRRGWIPPTSINKALLRREGIGPTRNARRKRSKKKQQTTRWWIAHKIVDERKSSARRKPPIATLAQFLGIHNSLAIEIRTSSLCIDDCCRTSLQKTFEDVDD
jgi:hypothetical protein